MDLRRAPLEEIVRCAAKIGKTIDLHGIGYGRIHWGNFKDVIDEPYPYYFLLAGITRLCTAARICEIGTHYGGSTRSLRRGVASGIEPDIVTIDISKKSDPQLAGETGIRKIVGDAGSKAVLQATAVHFGRAGIDVLFIDSHHSFGSTLMHYCHYATLLRPRFIVLDDITLNDEMTEVWQLIRASLPTGEAVNADVIEPGVRGDPGLGVVRLEQNFVIPANI